MEGNRLSLSADPNQEISFNVSEHDLTFRIHEFRHNFFVDAYMDEETVTHRLPLVDGVKLLSSGAARELGANFVFHYGILGEIDYRNFSDEVVYIELIPTIEEEE